MAAHSSDARFVFGPIEVQVLGQFPEESLKTKLDALNLAARRPSPTNALSFLKTAWEHDEFAPAERELLFLVAFEGDMPVGYLPLRRIPGKVLKATTWTVGFALTHDRDRPTLVCRPEDEDRCAEAFLRFLTEERGWTFLEFAEQDDSSALAQVASRLDFPHHFLRRFENAPNSTIPLPFASLDEYFRAVPQKHRHNIARLGRRLVNAGELAWVSSTDPSALGPLFELYLLAEHLSWKQAAQGTVARHPKRVSFYRELLEGRSDLQMSISFLLLDGLPISAMINGLFVRWLFGMEIIFAEAFSDLAPGGMMLLLCIRDAISRGCVSFNLMANYAHFKSRWMADVTETRSVQLFQVGSLNFYKALVGDLRRKVLPVGLTQERAEFNLAKNPAAKAEGLDPELCRRLRESAKETLGVVERSGAKVEHLTGAALMAQLPFSASGVGQK